MDAMVDGKSDPFIGGWTPFRSKELFLGMMRAANCQAQTFPDTAREARAEAPQHIEMERQRLQVQSRPNTQTQTHTNKIQSYTLRFFLRVHHPSTNRDSFGHLQRRSPRQEGAKDPLDLSRILESCIAMFYDLNLPISATPGSAQAAQEQLETRKRVELLVHCMYPVQSCIQPQH